uniref:Reverse transcriptase domain-containing protein n=1 Tax=Amphimedon queenslandica TaxID=400682 RepID=A0A1X7UNT5_AMPQE
MFITPFGKYCFNKLPLGIASAPEHFQKRMSHILSGLDGVICLVDDVLVFGSNKRKHDSRLMRSLEQIRTAGVTLNKDTCEFGKEKFCFLFILLMERQTKR